MVATTALTAPTKFTMVKTIKEILLKLEWLLIGGRADSRGVKPCTFEAFKIMKQNEQL